MNIKMVLGLCSFLEQVITNTNTIKSHTIRVSKGKTGIMQNIRVRSNRKEVSLSWKNQKKILDFCLNKGLVKVVPVSRCKDVVMPTQAGEDKYIELMKKVERLEKYEEDPLNAFFEEFNLPLYKNREADDGKE